MKLGREIEIGPAQGTRVIRDLLVEFDHDLRLGEPVVFGSDPHDKPAQSESWSASSADWAATESRV